MGHDKDSPSDDASANVEADDGAKSQPGVIAHVSSARPTNVPHTSMRTLRPKKLRGVAKDLVEGVQSKRGRRLSDEVYRTLIESYRLRPGDHKEACKASGVDYRTAKKLYEEGSRGLVAIKGILEAEADQAKIAIARARSPSKMGLLEAAREAQAVGPVSREPPPARRPRRRKKGEAPPANEAAGHAVEKTPVPNWKDVVAASSQQDAAAGEVASTDAAGAGDLPPQWKPSGSPFLSARPPAGSSDALCDPFPPTLSKDRAALHAAGIELRRQEFEMVCNVRDIAIDTSVVMKHLLTGSKQLADRLSYELLCLARENLDQRLKPGEIQERVRLIGHVVRMAGTLGEVSNSVLKMQKELDNGKPFEGLSEDEDLGLNEALRLVNSVGPDAARIERKLRLIQGGGQMDREPGDEAPAVADDDAADESRPTGTAGP